MSSELLFFYHHQMLREGHTDADVVDMVKEMEIMKSVGAHPNVIGFVGACTRPAGRPLLLVVEYAANKNLREFLLAHRPTAAAPNLNFPAPAEATDSGGGEFGAYEQPLVRPPGHLGMRDMLSMGYQV